MKDGSTSRIRRHATSPHKCKASTRSVSCYEAKFRVFILTGKSLLINALQLFDAQVKSRARSVAYAR